MYILEIFLYHEWSHQYALVERHQHLNLDTLRNKHFMPFSLVHRLG